MFFLSTNNIKVREFRFKQSIYQENSRGNKKPVHLINKGNTNDNSVTNYKKKGVLPSSPKTKEDDTKGHLL